MDVRELRIGNIVLDDFSGEEGNVIEIHKTQIVVSLNSGIIKADLDSFSPVQLTEEWHKRLGEIKYFRNTFECRQNINNYGSIYAWQNGKCIFIRHVNYVHEWQNAYWILTNTELTQ